MRLWLCLFVFAIGLQARAELFRNSYVSFELPSNWNCKLEKTEWVCTSRYAKNVKEAIIILTAKEAGPSDNLDNFRQKLKSSKQTPNSKGALTPSKVHSLNDRVIAGHTWIDGLHEGSEIDSYYTRYLATVKDRLAILVSFSAHKKHYTKYSGDFLKSVNSLKVLANKNLLADRPNTSLPQSGINEMIGGSVEMIPTTEVAAPPPPKSGDMKTKLIALVLIVAAILILLKRRKK